MLTYTEAAQAASGEAIVFLYQIDLNSIGISSVLCFCKSNIDPTTSANVSFLGAPYEGVDVDATGFEWATSGSNPQPTLRIGNVGSFASGLLLQYGNLIGATVNRIRTFARYLDGHSDASIASSSYQVEQYRVEQKIGHNKVFVELRLAGAIDQEGRMLPSWRVLRDTCGFRYRGYLPTTDTFDYSKAVCPFVGAPYDINGNAVANNSQDAASHRFETCCKVRYGAGPYPFGGFRGVTRNQ